MLSSWSNMSQLQATKGQRVGHEEQWGRGQKPLLQLSKVIFAHQTFFNIKKVYFSADYKDAEAVGFRDDYIFNFIKDGCKNQNILELKQVDKSSIIKIYEKFVELKGEIY